MAVAVWLLSATAVRVGWMMQAVEASPVISPAPLLPALLLNADFRPLSYSPLSVYHWQDAVRAVFMRRVQVVSVYEGQMVRAANFAMPLPSVLALKDYVPMPRWPAFTRYNVFLRDRFTCQYCGIKKPSNSLTFDHVVPRCRGGKTNWQNVVAACLPCNLRKGSQVPQAVGMRLLTRPARPDGYLLQRHAMQVHGNHFHQTWQDFLYWDSELESVG
jgi:5-methylcytosine-specific restriction endonuclease McrA